MLYFAAHELACGGAIQVTGSHNPPTHNGFKMVMGGLSFFGDDIQELGGVSADGPARVDGGTVTPYAIEDAYVDRLAAGARATGLSIVWDCGNGASGPVTEKLVARLDGTHKVLFPEIDGTFPNHHPNPVDPETLDILRAEVKAAGADLGITEYGFNALLSLRLEKSYGIWSAEFTQGYTPGMTGMDRWIV